MRVLVIGANGNTGFRVIQRLADSSHEPVAMVRREDQKDRFEKWNVATVIGDLEHPIDQAVAGCDAVIFAAGSGAGTGKDKTVLVDHLGGIRAAVAALENGAKRFIMLSSLNAAPDAKTAITHYHRAKGHADHFLRTMDQVLDGRSLDWTIVHPGRLHDEDRSEKVALSTDLFGKATTSRDSVAAILVACLDAPRTIGRDIAVADGNEPLAEALRDF
ncbi:MAG: SDR family oxidoreductase [Phycisphaeraceae bacterium]|nr:SDR family oxidoreductase [Phycisphaeraceae bacterium]